ncbi:Dehydrogenase OXI1 [Lasiodiplodia hormozganensis]|uniref:Dehydrogenase OXI1 n=1 Tax=Lasiodiplodia hormozganensis TaxID=869390 RepID=A0AA39Y5K7_9PEZI|nr:Dehydrogenase OXI1 [Lasiodiplodia hormozganensis]
MTSTAQTQPLTLAGKVAIVTGGARGIGAATAIELAKRGANVAITFVSPSSSALADAIVDQIAALNTGATAIKIQADARDLASPAKIIAATTAAFGPSIDILVNNAGVLTTQPLGTITADEYAALFDANVRSAIFMTQAVLPHLRAPGRIINLGSTLARIGNPGFSVYSATKAALEALTRGWAAELGAQGHTVNVVAPALTETDMMTETGAAAGAGFDQVVQMQRMMTPLEHRLGKAEDIALAVAMVAEPASRWVTGQTIQAGGGIYMS